MVAAICRLTIGGLFILTLLGSASAAEKKLYSAENTQFEFVGLHQRSVSYIEELSRYVVAVGERYLDRDALQFPQRILVSLKPSGYIDFEGDYSVRVGERGFVNLDLRWEDSLSLLAACRALSEALLVRYSIFNFGQSGPDFLPKWPATAIGTKAYLILRPVQSSLLVDLLQPETTPKVEQVLKRKWSDPVEDLNGYAFLVAMEQSGLERQQIRRLLARNISGKNISEALDSLIQPDDPAAEGLSLNDWWRGSFSRLLAPVGEPMESMEVSRAWIEALVNLANTDYKELNMGQLWGERDNKGLRQLIEARYEILRLRIIRVNPAYFNAARALGALFETYLNGDKRHKYMHRLTGFLGDFEDSRELEETVLRALDKMEGPD